MKIRLLLTLTGLAIWFTVPTFAQQQSAVDPEVRQQIEALLVKGDQAYNKHDAAALAAGYTEDAVFVGGGGGPEPHYGRQAIEKRIALDMASYPGEVSQSHELIQVYALGLDVCAIEKLTIEQWKGYAVLLFVREPDEWKIRMEYVNTLIE
jgi:uncharacterized protein (TIGR02246 family)